MRAGLPRVRCGRLPPMNKPLNPRFPFLLHGGDYNPDQWRHIPGTVDEDFRLFPLAGINSVSVGIFSSALTNNQIIAFIIAAPLCFILSFGFAFIYSFESLGAVGYYIKSLGIEHHYASISKGVIDSRDIVYFCSVIFVFLFGTRIVLLKRKW